MGQVVGRFAPTPSGRMHLGNLFCSLLAWLAAKREGGRVVLRVEDLDQERTSPLFARQAEEDLKFLGLFWDEGGSLGGPHGPYEQGKRSPYYQELLDRLEALGLVYPCFCSRAELHAANAPHASDGEVVYSGKCRSLTAEAFLAFANQVWPGEAFCISKQPNLPQYLPSLVAATAMFLNKNVNDEIVLEKYPNMMKSVAGNDAE